MAKGGFRFGAGRPRGARRRPRESAKVIPLDIRRAARKLNQTPLEYALGVMDDPGADPARRDRMCAVAMPFVHPKATEPPGKKKRADAQSEHAPSA